MAVVDALAYLGESIYLKRSFSAEQLISRMDGNGIDMAIVTAPPPGPDYLGKNRIVYEATLKYPERLIGLYKLNPWYGEKELERARASIEDWGFRGFKLDPRDDGYSVEAPIVKPVMELAERLNVPVFFQVGDSDFCPPEAVAFLAESYPNVTVVSRWTPLGVRLAVHPKLKEGLSRLVFGTYPLRGSGPDGVDPFLRRMPEPLDPSRVVFTSEVPFGYPELELRIIELSKLDESVKRLVMGENIKRVLGI